MGYWNPSDVAGVRDMRIVQVPYLSGLGYKTMLVGNDRQVDAPIVTRVQAGYAYSLADTGKARMGLMRQDLPDSQASGQTYDTAIPDATIYYTVNVDVTLRIPFYAPAARSFVGPYSQGSNSPSQTWEYDIDGGFTDRPNRLNGFDSLGKLRDEMRDAAARGQIPYCGDLRKAVVSSGGRSTSYPYDLNAAYGFQWPSAADDYVAPGGFTSSYQAQDYIPGWIPGFSLKSVKTTFTQQEYRFDTEFVVGIAAYGLYRMHDGSVEMNGSDTRSFGQ